MIIVKHEKCVLNNKGLQKPIIKKSLCAHSILNVLLANHHSWHNILFEVSTSIMCMEVILIQYIVLKLCNLGLILKGQCLQQILPNCNNSLGALVVHILAIISYISHSYVSKLMSSECDTSWYDTMATTSQAAIGYPAFCYLNWKKLFIILSDQYCNPEQGFEPGT